jgi:hypothetical protein
MSSITNTYIREGVTLILEPIPIKRLKISSPSTRLRTTKHPCQAMALCLYRQTQTTTPLQLLAHPPHTHPRVFPSISFQLHRQLPRPLSVAVAQVGMSSDKTLWLSSGSSNRSSRLSSSSNSEGWAASPNPSNNNSHNNNSNSDTLNKTPMPVYLEVNSVRRHNRPPLDTRYHLNRRLNQCSRRSNGQMASRGNSSNHSKDRGRMHLQIW